ncbi:MAG TPA: hypothetical protein VG848_00230, partial [Acetobacteraceae bacterium]|nr:hypothetical protein [Acetobacteraceae bacterium]
TAAINRLITEPHFRENARRLGDAIRADIASSSLVEEMEAIAEAGPRRNPLVQGRIRQRSLEEADSL